MIECLQFKHLILQRGSLRPCPFLNPHQSLVSPLDKLLWAVVGLLLTIVGTFVQVSVPVPPWNWSSGEIQALSLGVTYQVGAVLLVGCLGGKSAGALSQIVYLILGLSGLQVFAYGGGLSYLKEPTFGYLVGFIPGAWACGYLAFQKEARLEFLASSCLGGLAVIHLLGLIYLGLLAISGFLAQNWWSAAFEYSLQPLPGQLVLVCLVTVISAVLRRILFY